MSGHGTAVGAAGISVDKVVAAVFDPLIIFAAAVDMTPCAASRLQHSAAAQFAGRAACGNKLPQILFVHVILLIVDIFLYLATPYHSAFQISTRIDEQFTAISAAGES